MIRQSLKFARIRIIATCASILFLGSAYSGSITIKTLLGLVLIVGFTIHANSINDYSDKEIDKINLKNAHDRPLATNHINSKQLWIINAVSGLLILLVSLIYGLDVFILSIFILLIDYAYSLKPFRITNRTILSPVLLSVSYVYYSFSIGFLSTPTTSKYPWLLTIGLSFGFFARLLLKDFRDVVGDKKFGKITFLIRYGQSLTCLTSGIFWAFALFLIIKASSFNLALGLVLLVAFIESTILLNILAKEIKYKNQEKLISYIAKAANYTIITILAYLLCVAENGITNRQTQVITVLVGMILLTYNWLEYRMN